MKRFSNFGQEIYQEDCLTCLKTMPDNFVDVIVTSCPYNLGIKYNSYKDNKKRDDFLNWCGEWASELKRVAKLDASFFLNVGGSNKDPWIATDIANTLRSKWQLQNDIIWVKSITVDGRTFGHFKPINSSRFLNLNFEHIFHFTKEGDVNIDRTADGVGVPYTDKSNIKRWTKKLDVRCGGNVWYIPYQTINSKLQKGKHPAIFPELLPEKCIRLHGLRPDLIVLDPFVGTGTTLVVTKRLGIRGIGIEIDKVYVDYAIERLREANLGFGICNV